MTLSELLEGLEAVDPETWDAVVRGISLKPFCQYFTFDRCGQRSHQYQDVYLPFSQMEKDVALLWIQGCIQRACERREWHWLVCMDCWREGEYRAEMSIISESCISDMVEITTIAVNYPPINWRACNSHWGYIWPVDFGLAYPHRTPLARTALATYSGKCRHMPHTQAKDCSYHALRSIVTQNAYRLKPYFSGISECLNLFRGG